MDEESIFSTVDDDSDNYLLSPHGNWKWKYSMRRDMQEILPGLYLGPYSSAAKAKLSSLLLHGITHIICIRQPPEAHIIKPNFPDKFKYLTIEMVDTSLQNIIPHILNCRNFIDQCLNSGGKCLVHSYLAISRSPSIVIAYVMGKKSLSFQQALDFVKFQRYCVSPNDGFLKQLSEYEVIYKAEQTASQGQCSRPNGNLKRKCEFEECERDGYEPMDSLS